MHLLIALKAFFLVLFNGARARQVDEVLRRGAIVPEPTERSTSEPATIAPHTADTIIVHKTAPPTKAAAPSKAVRSEAITLLAALQREGRLVDFLKESLADYSDAQIGAVARDLHRDCGKVVE